MWVALTGDRTVPHTLDVKRAFGHPGTMAWALCGVEVDTATPGIVVSVGNWCPECKVPKRRTGRLRLPRCICLACGDKHIDRGIAKR